MALSGTFRDLCRSGTGCAKATTTRTRPSRTMGVTVKHTFGILAVGAMLVGGVTKAGALALTPADTTCTTNVNSNLNDAALYAQLEGCFDVTAPSPLALIYKQDTAEDEGDPLPPDVGSHASSY